MSDTKFLQITGVADALFALGSDLQVYTLRWYEETTDEETWNEYGGKEKVIRRVYFWLCLDYPIGDPRAKAVQP